MAKQRRKEAPPPPEEQEEMLHLIVTDAMETQPDLEMWYAISALLRTKGKVLGEIDPEITPEGSLYLIPIPTTEPIRALLNKAPQVVRWKAH